MSSQQTLWLNNSISSEHCNCSCLVCRVVIHSWYQHCLLSVAGIFVVQVVVEAIRNQQRVLNLMIDISELLLIFKEITYRIQPQKLIINMFPGTKEKVLSTSTRHP